MRFLTRLVREEKGSSLVIVMLAMVALLGSAAMVTDYGLLAAKRRALATAADAAALAGAQELVLNPGAGSQALEKAVEYAVLNGVEPEVVEAGLSHGGRAVTVTVRDNVQYSFARVLGFFTGDVSATATALTGTVSALTGVVPLTIVEQDFVKGQEYHLKSFPAGELGPGNFGALALGGKGAANYKKNLSRGYQGQIKVGDILETEPGNMSGPTRAGFLERVNRCQDNCTFANFKPGCPLLVYIPVIKQPTGGGRQEVEVVGFAAFFLNKNHPPKQGNQSIIRGWFVDTIVTGQIDDNAADYGVTAVNLIR
ncbi:MAG: hypothetical protein GX200_05860 [Firmicutes bacterium]|nr:hypothetical protein [Bacillota bacterium]